MDTIFGLRIFEVNINLNKNTNKFIYLGFRQCIYDEYYLTIFYLGHKLFEAFSLSLNLPSNYFKSMCQKAMVTMRLLHYPLQPIIIDQDQLGCGKHTH
jgi:isopenicillin N synthase-like dioxygenase